MTDSGSDENDTAVVPADGGPTHGTRFTPETAQAAGRKGAEARKAKALERRQAAEDQAADLVELAEALGGARQGVGPVAFAGALALADRIRRGKVEDRHLHYAAQAVEKLVTVGRLEAGDPTSTTFSVTADAADFRTWMHRLRDELADGKPEATSTSQVVEVEARAAELEQG